MLISFFLVLDVMIYLVWPKREESVALSHWSSNKQQQQTQGCKTFSVIQRFEVRSEIKMNELQLDKSQAKPKHTQTHKKKHMITTQLFEIQGERLK